MTWYCIFNNNIQQQHPIHQTIKKNTIDDKKVKLQLWKDAIVGFQDGGKRRRGRK